MGEREALDPEDDLDRDLDLVLLLDLDLDFDLDPDRDLDLDPLPEREPDLLRGGSLLRDRDLTLPSSSSDPL